VSLAADDYLVVFASSKDRAVAGGQLHTNFKLNGNGEYLALVEPDGVSVAHEYAPRFPRQLADVSYGVGDPTLTSESLVTPVSEVDVLVPTVEIGDDWKGVNFSPPAEWINGEAAVGFDLDPAGGQDPLADAVVGYWRMDTDADGGGGVSVSNEVADVNGTIASYPQLNVASVTVEFWARTNEEFADFFQRFSGAAGLRISQPDQTTVEYYVGDGAGGSTGVTLPDVHDFDGDWDHFAFTYDRDLGRHGHERRQWFRQRQPGRPGRAADQQPRARAVGVSQGRLCPAALW
jgi:hypothetical protein